jgi:hypothetical protein
MEPPRLFDGDGIAKTLGGRGSKGLFLVDKQLTINKKQHWCRVYTLHKPVELGRTRSMDAFFSTQIPI